MSLYTERHGMRKPIDRTSIISGEMYALLFACCEKYYENLAWKYPEECPDGRGCCGLHHGKMDTELKFRIPTLYRDKYSGAIAPPRTKDYSRDEYEAFDQYALLDYIEFFAQNVSDISRRSFHSFFGHDDLSFSDTAEVFGVFRNDINEIFNMTGLLYVMSADKVIERITENNVLSVTPLNVIFDEIDKGTRELLNEAIILFRQPRPQDQQKAVEKIWDALESLKTHFPGIEKNRFDEKLAKKLANGQSEIEGLLKKELSVLGNIGNNFSIRHFNNTQVEIIDSRHYDYFFNRCLSFISFAVQYFSSGEANTDIEDELPF